MLKQLKSKTIESLLSVLPIVVIVLCLNPWIRLDGGEIAAFCVSALFLVIGIILFNIGADMSMTPMGNLVGSGLTKSKKLSLLLVVCFAMGLLITIAEPDLSVLADQVASVINSTALIVTVGAGVGIFLLIAVLKIIFHKDLSAMLMFFYMTLFAIAAILLDSGRGMLLPVAFDSGGVTTGPITVPFIMALGVGIASTIGGKNSGENSFGLVALCSVGPVLAVLILSFTSKGTMTYMMPDYSLVDSVSGIMKTFLHEAFNVLRALALIVIFFFGLNILILKLPKQKIIRIIVGIALTYIGLVVFLTAVSVGFMPIGYKIGTRMATEFNQYVVVIIGFVLGVVVVLAEPAVQVLNKQVEEITNRAVTHRTMMIALAVGSGISLALSLIRIIFNFSILFYLIPGYLISLGLSLLVPKMYTGIAFDSGGVASGPLTSGFILPMSIGFCSIYAGPDEVLGLGFGIVAMVAMTPLITIQILGFRSILSSLIRYKRSLRRIVEADDEQIIYFE